MKQKIDLESLLGQQFGRLTIIRAWRIKGGPARSCIWCECRCSCGNTKEVRLQCLRSGNTQSCRCLGRELVGNRRRTHGKTFTPEWEAWRRMVSRCEKKHNPDYPNYGGRGIAVCLRWRTFDNFLTDMGVRPSPTHSLDRINNNGDYEPSNCRWATKREQTLNRSTTQWVTFNNETRCLRDWSSRVGVSDTCIAHRLKRGMSVHDALTLPRQKRGKSNRESAK